MKATPADPLSFGFGETLPVAVVKNCRMLGDSCGSKTMSWFIYTFEAVGSVPLPPLLPPPPQPDITRSMLKPNRKLFINLKIFIYVPSDLLPR
jgi:hypothetical protein